jgi:hypothetical protein
MAHSFDNFEIASQVFGEFANGSAADSPIDSVGESMLSIHW